MSNSRRKFLRTGLLAALFAAVPFKQAFAQSWKDRDGNPGETPVAQIDPLGNYSKATFTSYLNSIFQLHTSAGIVEVTLEKLDDMPAPKGGECFSLLFRGGSVELKQGTYVLVHPSLGTFQLFLVPAGPDQNGAQGHLATLNRLSAVDAANMTPPSRSTRPTPATTMPALPVINSAPIVTSVPAPVVPATAPPPLKSKGRRKRKRIWKRNENFYR